MSAADRRARDPLRRRRPIRHSALRSTVFTPAQVKPHAHTDALRIAFQARFARIGPVRILAKASHKRSMKVRTLPRAMQVDGIDGMLGLQELGIRSCMSDALFAFQSEELRRDRARAAVCFRCRLRSSPNGSMGRHEHDPDACRPALRHSRARGPDARGRCRHWRAGRASNASFGAATSWSVKARPRTCSTSSSPAGSRCMWRGRRRRDCRDRPGPAHRRESASSPACREPPR